MLSVIFAIMKTSRIPLIVLVLCCLGYLGFLTWTAPLLPERSASHFGASGEADGWMHRSSYLPFMAVVGLAVPCFLVALIYSLTRFLPIECCNLPNRDYWFGPETRRETCTYILYHSCWYGSLFVLFFAGIHWLTIQANRQGAESATLSIPGMIVVSGGFLLATIVWIISMMRHFKKAPSQKSPSTPGDG